jgi:outer membrane protein
MKKRAILAGFVLSLVLLVSTSYAQVNPKFGYIDSNELLEAMPGRDTIERALQDYGQSLEGQLQAMYQEYQTKVADYQQNSATMSTIIRQTKERELADMETRIQEFQQQADIDLQNKQMELLEPLLTKAKNAIEAVAEENGYTYIFDAGVGMLLYYEKGDDILPLVKAKLGLD